MFAFIKYYYNKILLALLDIIIINIDYIDTDINYTFGNNYIFGSNSNSNVFAGVEFRNREYSIETDYEDDIHLRIKKYKMMYFTNKKKNLDNLSCGICFDKYKLKTRVIILDCKHSYHYKCVRKWLRYGDTCPLCRKYI